LGFTYAHLYSITTNQAAIIALFRVANCYVGNLAPMPGVFTNRKAPPLDTPEAGPGSMRQGHLSTSN
jgi:hypothetical protein